MILKVKYKGKSYTLTFDEYSVLDTVENEQTGKLMNSRNAIVKYFLTHINKIMYKNPVKHIEYV